MFAENPLFQQLTHQSVVLDKKYKVVQLNSKSKLGVGLEYAIVNPRTDSDMSGMQISGHDKDIVMPMISLSLPIFQKKYTAAQQENLLSYKSSMQLQIEALTNELSSHRKKAILQSGDALSRVDLYREQIQITEQAFTSLSAAFSSADSDFEEVLQIQQPILNYQLTLAIAITDEQTAKAKKEFLLYSNHD